MKRHWVLYVLCLAGFLWLLAGLAAAPPRSAAAGRDATATFAPALVISPLAIDFGPVGTGALSDPITVTFFNVGESFIGPFDSGLVGAPFLRSHNCDAGLPAHTTCQYEYRFAPEQAGDFTATATFVTEAGEQLVTLRGRGVGSRLRVSPFIFDFGPRPQSSSAPEQTATLYNDGLAPWSLFEITAPGTPFSVTPNCVGGVGPGGSCPLLVDFTTSAISEGVYTTPVHVSTTDGQSREITLMGSAHALLPAARQQVSPRGIDFGPAQIGAPLPAQKVTVYNLSTTDHLIDWEPGDLAPPFSVTTNCQDDIDPATNCEFNYTFDPTVAGVFTATHQFSNNLGPVEIQLRGEGVEPQITADALILEFEPMAPGQTSPSQTVTIRNTGIAPLPALYGGAPNPADFGASTTCGGVLAPGQTCFIFYNFQPGDLGRYNSISRLSLDPAGKRFINIQLLGGRLFPELSFAFDPAVVEPGDVTTLYIIIDNPNRTLPLGELALDAELPAGLVVADPPMTSLGADCGGGSFQPVAGGSALPFSGEISGSRECELAVNVTAAAEGEYEVSGQVSSDGGPSNTAAATLTVQSDVPPPPSYRVWLPFARR